MQSSTVHFGDLLTGERRYIIPVYQRKYTWDSSNCKTLFKDVMDLLKDRYSGNENHDPKRHFLGTCALAPCTGHGNTNTSIVIDGQQRFTTVTLLLKAIKDLSEDEGLTVDPDSYIYNAARYNGECSLRIYHYHRAERNAFHSLIKAPNNCAKNQFYRNYILLKDLLQKEYDRSSRQCTFYNDIRDEIVNHLYLIQLRLDQGEDPQIIFQTINSTGKPLKIDELVKNYLLLTSNLDVSQSDEHYNLWLSLERAARIDSNQNDQNTNSNDLDNNDDECLCDLDSTTNDQDYLNKFIRTFIMYKLNTRDIPAASESLGLYERFVEIWDESPKSKADIMREMTFALMIYKYLERGEISCNLNNDHLTDQTTLMTLRKIRNTNPHQEWYPFLMHIIIDFLDTKTAITTPEILNNTLRVFLKYAFQLTLSGQKKTINSLAPHLFDDIIRNYGNNNFDRSLDHFFQEQRCWFTRDELISLVCSHKLPLEIIDLILNDLSDLSASNTKNKLLLQDNEGGKPKNSKEEFLGNVTKLNAGRLKNAAFSTQLLAIRRESNISLINDDFTYHDRDDWNDEDIRRRTRRLAECLADRYSIDGTSVSIPAQESPTNSLNVPQTGAADTHDIDFANLTKAILLGEEYPFERDNYYKYWNLFKALTRSLAEKIDTDERYDYWASLPYEPDLALPPNFPEQSPFSEQHDPEESRDIKISIRSQENTENASTLYLNFINTPDVLTYFQNTLLPYLKYNTNDVIFQ